MTTAGAGIGLMAAISHKDWLSRRQRQKQGIERAHSLGKYRGKQADRERHQKVLYYRQVKKLSIRETAEATGYSSSQVFRIQALYHKASEDGKGEFPQSRSSKQSREALREILCDTCLGVPMPLDCLRHNKRNTIT